MEKFEMTNDLLSDMLDQTFARGILEGQFREVQKHIIDKSKYRLDNWMNDPKTETALMQMIYDVKNGVPHGEILSNWNSNRP